jgi:peptidoglycan-associated lipoprotein
VVGPPPPAPPRAPERVEDRQPVAPLADEGIDSRSLDELNRNSPLQPVFYDFDSSEVNAAAQGVLATNATVLKKYPSWTITIEGHCDERGTAEYNLALGERRAVAARAYLVSLGIPADRLRTVSYGKEFPFDPGHDESAWAKNRRAHFVVTSK